MISPVSSRLCGERSGPREQGGECMLGVLTLHSLKNIQEPEKRELPLQRSCWIPRHATLLEINSNIKVFLNRMRSPQRSPFFASPQRHPYPPPQSYRAPVPYHPQHVFPQQFQPRPQQYLPQSFPQYAPQPQRFPSSVVRPAQQYIPQQSYLPPVVPQQYVPHTSMRQFYPHPQVVQAPQFQAVQAPQFQAPQFQNQFLLQSPVRSSMFQSYPGQVVSPQRLVLKGSPPVQSPPRVKVLSPKKEETQPTAKPVDDDIEKRFEQALQRTKKIVDGFPAKPATTQQPEETQNIQTEKSEEEEQEPEDLALQYEDGFIYRGQGYQPQTRNGFGILTDQNENEVYAGFWKDNYYHGQGKLSNLEQENHDDPIDWEDMKSIGDGWASYDGEFNQGKMHGTGTLQLTNGEKYVGEFQEGMVHGEGEFTTQGGDVIKGSWDQGLFVKD